MKLDTHPVTGEPREYLIMPPRRRLKRFKLRSPEAVARRRKYKAEKPRKARIRCSFCNKRFTPKRSTRKFCSPACRNKSNIQEHKLFREKGINDKWSQLPVEVRKNVVQIKVMRQLLAELE